MGEEGSWVRRAVGGGGQSGEEGSWGGHNGTPGWLSWAAGQQAGQRAIPAAHSSCCSRRVRPAAEPRLEGPYLHQQVARSCDAADVVAVGGHHSLGSARGAAAHGQQTGRACKGWPAVW